jgi:hypothetical protein
MLLPTMRRALAFRDERENGRTTLFHVILHVYFCSCVYLSAYYLYVSVLPPRRSRRKPHARLALHLFSTKMQRRIQTYF